MPHTVNERPVVPEEVGEVGLGQHHHWHQWILLSALALVVIAGAVAVATGAAGWRPAVSSPGARPATAAGFGTGVVNVLPATGQVRSGPSFPEVNGIADGLGRLWLTGGTAGRSHVLYAVNPATSRVDARVELPSRLVINPNDVAIGSGAVWVAVGASIYRVEPASTLPASTLPTRARQTSTGAGGAVARAFATLRSGGLIGDIVVGAGAVWVTDTTHGRVYRFAVSTGRLEAVIAVGTTAGAMAVGDGGVWVADDDAHRVSRISVRHNRVDSVLPVPGIPSHIAASDGGVWVTDGAGSAVTVLDRASGRVLTVPVGAGPTGVAAIGDTVWVANTAGGTLSRIDARRHVVVATVPVGARPYAVAVDRRGVWVAVLGRPVMMHTLPAPSPATGQSAWQQRLCGQR
jgi:YVTN family beta-propeller protein